MPLSLSDRWARSSRWFPLRRPASARLRLEALEDRTTPTTFTVTGKVQWTDSAGSVHLLPRAAFEVLEYTESAPRVVGTGETSLTGTFSLSIDDGRGPDADAPDIFLRVYARSLVADIRPTGPDAVTYSFDSDLKSAVANGSTQSFTLTAGNETEADRAFSIHHCLLVMGQYAGKLAGKIPSQLDVRFDNTVTDSSINPGRRRLSLRGSAAYEWDVIGHEYGHYVQGMYGFEDNPGGAHGINDNLAQTRASKPIGIRLAWGEGWPTFFSIAAQVQMGTSVLGIAGVGDTVYKSFDGGIEFDLETSRGVGEDNEVSVIATLWDLFDDKVDGNDLVSIADKTLFEVFRNAAVTTLGSAWEALAALEDVAGKARLGAVFGMDNVAPDLLGPADNTTVTTKAPTFSWKRNGAGTPNPLDDFRIRFYTSNFSRLVFEKSLGDVSSWTPAAEEWKVITAGGSSLKWIVEGRSSSNPSTPGGTLGWYWSGARTIGAAAQVSFVIDDTGSMGEEISSVQSALLAYLDQLEKKLRPGESAPTIQLITFKDSVTLQLVSNQFNEVREAINALRAQGGEDAPEFGAHALALAADTIAPGGTILFATDAPSKPGVDMGAVLAKLRAKGVSVNVILSGDGSGTGGGAIATPPPVGTPPPSGGSTPVPVPMGPGPYSEPTPDGHDSDSVEEFDGSYYDPGQFALDDYGDTVETAASFTTVLGTIGGIVRAGYDTDVFRVELAAGVRYTIYLQGVAGGRPQIQIFGRDGLTVLNQGYVLDGSGLALVVTPTESGIHTIHLRAAGMMQDDAYLLSITDDPLAGVLGAVELYSTIASATGGAFVYRGDVNSGNTIAYRAAILNVLGSLQGATVLSAGVGELTQGQTVAVTLTGRGTNWRPGYSMVEFSDPRLQVRTVEVLSPTELRAIVQVPGSFPVGYYGVTVTTPMGVTVETASGIQVVHIEAAPVEATLTSVEGGPLARGATATLTVRGEHVLWDARAQVSLGAGVSVVGVRVLSPTLMEVDVQVAQDAGYGYRSLSVTMLGQKVELERAFVVSPPSLGIPQVVSLDRSGVQVGKVAAITVRGANTHFVAGQTTASFGEGVRVREVRVVSATEAVVTVEVLNTRGGHRNVSLTTGNETAVMLGGFYVDTTRAGQSRVQVKVVNGIVSIVGDGIANRLSIFAGTEGVWVVGGSGTLVNDTVAPLFFRSIGIGSIDLGGGNDLVSLLGVKQNIDLVIRAGAGNDTVRTTNSYFGRNLVVNTGIGRDQVQLMRTTVQANWYLDVFPGVDTLSCTGVQIRRKRV